MFTWGSRYLFAISGVSLLGAALYGLFSGGGPLGVVSIGYKGGVGDHTGYAVLVALAVASGALAVLNLILRDGDADEAAASVGASQALVVSTPKVVSFWGPLTAFGVGCLAVGLSVGQGYFILGVVVLSIVTLNWTVLAWSDRATGDAEVNDVIRQRVLGPLEIPMLSMLGIAVLVIAVSRVLLAVPAAAATSIAALLAAIVFATAIGIAKSNAGRSVIAVVVAVGAVAVLAGGIVGAAFGEREIEHHGAETTDHGDEGEGE